MMCFSYNSDIDCDMVVPIPDSYIIVKLLLNCIYSYSLGSSTRKYSAGPLGEIHNDHTHHVKEHVKSFLFMYDRCDYDKK
jgi:hypothetical protein